LSAVCAPDTPPSYRLCT